MKKFKKHTLIALASLLSATGCSAIGAKKTATATAKGFGGEVSVTLTSKNNMLTNVEITGEHETEQIGIAAIKKLQQSMIEAKSIDTDIVSGATITSNAVLSAARKAWTEITGESSEAAVSMKPGIYTGTAPGFRSAWDIEVEVEVDETSIKSIKVNPDSADTVGIFQSAADQLPERIVDAQSLEVNAISGATVSSNAIKSATRNALEQALNEGGSDISAIDHFTKETVQSEEVIELDTDILVVGLGASGTTAALSAAEAMHESNPDHVSVLAIDKAGRYGGASSLCAGVFAVNPEGLEVTYNNGNEFTDKKALLEDWLAYTEGDSKPEMIELLLDHSGETLDWLVEDYGLELEAPKQGLTATDSNIVLFSYAPAKAGMTVRRQHNIAFYDRCMKKFEELGGRYQLETEAYDFLTDKDGAVTGVKARSMKDGTEYVIHARKVIMGTGGFLSNSGMTKKYLSDEYYPLSGSWDMIGMKQNDGILIEAALKNGAGTFNIGMSPAVHIIGASQFLTSFEYHTIEGKIMPQTMKNTKWTEGDLPHYMGVAPDSLAVNTKGERITNEQNLGFNAWTSGPHFYSVYSEDQIKAIEERGLRSEPAFMNTVNLGANGWAPAGTPITNAHDVMNAAMEAGYVFKADTISELAKQLEMDPAVLEKTITTYNEACEKGIDEEFGKAAEMLDPLSGNGPFYAIKMSNYPYSTCAALDVNENLQVLKIDGTPMSGLYAAGLDASGVLYSEKKPYVTYGGVDQGFAFTSGKLAGAAAVQDLK